MLCCTTHTIAGQEVTETLGLVRGASTRTCNVIHDVTEWFRNLVGAELEHYTKLLAEAREQAIERMIADAHRLDADAIIGLKITTNHVVAGAAEVLAYGTAVKLRPTR
jgi:uncharacterized protein YbjQ (UPF0145 family)